MKQYSYFSLTADLPKIPVVFLDFDGVCTACDATPGSYITNRGSNYGASKKCMFELLKLLSNTGAKVVISSNWRRFEPNGVWRTGRFGDVRNPLPKLLEELGDFCIGALPPIRHVSKSEALRIWFDENTIDPSGYKYVILDDDDREGFEKSEFAEHFVMTDFAVGFTEKDRKKTERILMS